MSPPAPAVAAAPAPVAAPAPSLAEPRVIAASDSTPSYEDEPEARPSRGARRNWKRRSTGMMVGGIVMVSVAPVSLLLSLIASMQQDACQRRGTYNLQSIDADYLNCDRYDATIYGGLILGVGLLGAGIPLIVVGGKRQPLGTASVAPWATPEGGGLRLRLDL